MKNPVQIDPNVMLPDFTITGYNVHDCTVTYTTGKAYYCLDSVPYVSDIIHKQTDSMCVRALNYLSSVLLESFC